MTVTIPPDTDARIAAGHYPPCRRCSGEGVLRARNTRRSIAVPEEYLEWDCPACYGQGVRIPLHHVLINGVRL